MFLKRERGASFCEANCTEWHTSFYTSMCICIGYLFLKSELAGAVKTVSADFALRQSDSFDQGF